MFLTNDTGEMTAQLTRLLRDEETDNCPLLLEIVSGGGVNRRILGYLFGISVAHKQVDIQNRAMDLLKKHASNDTLTQAQRLKSSLPYYYNEAEYLGKYKNPEFDLFDFLLAYKMCSWHGSGYSRSDRYRYNHQSLNLSSYPDNTLTDAIATLDFVKSIILPAHKDFDLEHAYQYLLKLPLENIFIENVRLLRFPNRLFDLPMLKILSIKRGTYRPRVPMTVAETEPRGSDTLEKLIVDGYPMEQIQHLGPFPKLKEAFLVRCTLENIDFLSASKQLEVLNIKFNLLPNLPAFLGGLSGLKTIELSGNPFKKIEIDLSNLGKLEEFEIKLKYDRTIRFY